jgi:hypothetical protein
MNKAGSIPVMLLMWCCVSTTPAPAQDVNGNPANWCRNGLFPAEKADFKLAKVNELQGARTHFYSDEENCPSADSTGARPQGNELILVEEDCRVALKLVGDFLIVSDNSQCGGANVRFNGVYRRGR